MWYHDTNSTHKFRVVARLLKYGNAALQNHSRAQKVTLWAQKVTPYPKQNIIQNIHRRLNVTEQPPTLTRRGVSLQANKEHTNIKREKGEKRKAKHEPTSTGSPPARGAPVWAGTK